MSGRLSVHRHSSRAEAPFGFWYVVDLAHRVCRALTVAGACTCLVLVLLSVRAARADGGPEHPVAQGVEMAAGNPAGPNELTYDGGAENPSPTRTRFGPRFPERYPLFLTLLVGIGQTVVIGLGLRWAFVQIYRMP